MGGACDGVRFVIYSGPFWSYDLTVNENELPPPERDEQGAPIKPTADQSQNRPSRYVADDFAAINKRLREL